ncbi:MAG TPA: hypothetical protein VMU54_10950 [Planctomycetota bacterium]|nr:hypothetical protein [Planctomycetota bacterium]
MSTPVRAIVLQILLLAAQETSTLAPEPSKEAQGEKLKILKETFKAEYAKKTPADQQSLAQKLLALGLETQDDPVARFVMLREAREIAVTVGDVETALRAIDGTRLTFMIDAVALKMGVLTKSASLAKDPEVARAVARGYLAVVPEAVRVDDYDSAASAATRAEALSRGAQDPSLAARAGEVKRDVATMKEEYQKVKSDLDKVTPADPEAVGRYLCFVRGDWEKGLLTLSLGAKGALKSAVDKDLGKPREADPQAETGDGWYELAQKEKSGWKKNKILSRAQYWYEQAAATASGLTRVKVEKRLDDLEALKPGFVNLLKLVDPKKDAVTGTWKVQDGKLVSDKTKFCRIEIPYKPPAEYDLLLSFSRVDGSSDINVLLSHSGKAFACIMGGGNISFGLGMCRGLWTDKPDNPTVVSVSDAFGPGRTYTALIEVRRDRVRLLVDEKQIFNWKTDYSDLSMSSAWKLRDDSLLGLGSYESSVAFHKFQMIEVSGNGKRTR